jgi:hypothetical protein
MNGILVYFILAVTGVYGDGSTATKLTVFNDLQTCQAEGAKVSDTDKMSAHWRCAAIAVSIHDRSVTLQAD